LHLARLRRAAARRELARMAEADGSRPAGATRLDDETMNTFGPQSRASTV
jgi:hypothetical protein